MLWLEVSRSADGSTQNDGSNCLKSWPISILYDINTNVSSYHYCVLAMSFIQPTIHSVKAMQFILFPIAHNFVKIYLQINIQNVATK